MLMHFEQGPSNHTLIRVVLFLSSRMPYLAGHWYCLDLFVIILVDTNLRESDCST